LRLNAKVREKTSHFLEKFAIKKSKKNRNALWEENEGFLFKIKLQVLKMHLEAIKITRGSFSEDILNTS
jgi:hypothetical protein